MNLTNTVLGFALTISLSVMPLAAQQPAPVDIARQPATATIHGLILTPASERIPAVLVSAIRVFPIGLPNSASHAVANDHGIYRIEGLSNGSYKLCVSPAGTAWLNPCLWSVNPPLLNVTSGQEVRMDVPLQEGVWLYVQVEDEDGSVAQKEVQAGSRNAVSVSVKTTAGYPEDLVEVSRNAKSRSFRIAVPRGKDIPLSVAATDLAFQGSDGKLVEPAAGSKTVNVTTATQTITFKAKQNAKTPEGIK